jgi:hypothetical protein
MLSPSAGHLFGGWGSQREVLKIIMVLAHSIPFEEGFEKGGILCS